MAVLTCRSTAMVMCLICRGEQEMIYLLKLQSKWSRQHESQVFLVMMLFSNTVIGVEIGGGGSPWESVFENVRISERCLTLYVGRALQAKVGGSSVVLSFTADTPAVFLHWTPVWLIRLKCAVIPCTATTKQLFPWHDRQNAERDLKMK